jgi:ribonuclease T2
MRRTWLPALILVCVCGIVAVSALNRHGVRAPGGFDYYMLSLSWAPNYCAGHPNDRSTECRPGQHANFVLHGLWPQANAGSPPVNCSPASPVSSVIVRHMLKYFPSRGMIQHEWEAHGACTGLSAADYFSQVEQAIDAIKIPDAYRNLNRDQNFGVSDVEKAFAAANNAPPGAFRISCHNGELVNLEACLTKDLGYQSCTGSARECPVSQVLLRTVR